MNHAQVADLCESLGRIADALEKIEKKLPSLEDTSLLIQYHDRAHEMFKAWVQDGE